MDPSTAKAVWVVDDDEHVRTIVSTLVEHAGHRAVTAAGGPEALALLETDGPPHLIILDIDMPSMDGFEVLTRLRQRGIATPVVMLTGRTKDEHVFEGYNSGADYYITKPFRAETVLNIVQFFLGDLSREQRAELEKKL